MFHWVFARCFATFWLNVLLGFGHALARLWLGVSWVLARCFAEFFLAGFGKVFCWCLGQALVAGLWPGVLLSFGHDLAGCFVGFWLGFGGALAELPSIAFWPGFARFWP